MEYQLATSTKISRIPLLPPLITSDITTEIQYYKQLAVAVEERLKVLEIAKQAALDKHKDKSNTGDQSTTDLLFKSESNSFIQDMTLISASVMNFSIKDKSENLIDIDTPVVEQASNECLIDRDISTSEPKQKQLEQVDKSISDEDKSGLNDTLLGDSVYSDTITASTDLNQYLNTSASTKTDTTETTPENWKPQVPKTLDIVPITLDQSKPPDKPALADGETPKLVRQGSYVLDTPSPLLLAHMQNEVTNTEYTPTSSAQSMKRKEWNISQLKANWDTQSNFKEPTSSRLNSASKCKRGAHTNIPSQRVCKSVSNSKTGSPLDVYQPAKSVDCIQTMFAKEYYSPKPARSKVSNQSQKYSSPVNGTNGFRNSGLKKPNKNTPILNLANKMSGSLGSLSSYSPKPVRRLEKKNDNDSSLNKSPDQSSVKSNDSSLNKSPDQNSAKSSDSSILLKQQKPVITSEKIVTVFKEIQDTHKKQMIELMSRQQKEQLLMQENFKKQQILLLAQIRKAFPEISLTALTEAITGRNTEHTTPLSSKAVNGKSDIDKPQINGIHSNEKVRQSFVKSSTDYDLSSRTASPYHQSSCQATQTSNGSSSTTSRVQSSNIRLIDDIPVGNQVRRNSSVSRQLFPHDKAPPIDNSIYTEKHIKAATIITAHAKGFLVRRLMKTEKIIALKNTYREALHCMLRLHVDAPLNLPELNFHQRLQLQCDAASMNIVDLFSQSPIKRMEIIAHDREIRKARSDRPSSARSYSFATQRTLARKKLKEMGVYPGMHGSMMTKSCPARTRCQTWTSNSRERRTTTSFMSQGIKRSTSAGAVRKPWR